MQAAKAAEAAWNVVPGVNPVVAQDFAVGGEVVRPFQTCREAFGRVGLGVGDQVGVGERAVVVLHADMLAAPHAQPIGVQPGAVSESAAGRSTAGPHHICSIITCPKPEQDTCVAPSMSRAKS